MARHLLNSVMSLVVAIHTPFVSGKSFRCLRISIIFSSTCIAIVQTLASPLRQAALDSRRQSRTNIFSGHWVERTEFNSLSRGSTTALEFKVIRKNYLSGVYIWSPPTILLLWLLYSFNDLCCRSFWHYKDIVFCNIFHEWLLFPFFRFRFGFPVNGRFYLLSKAVIFPRTYCCTHLQSLRILCRGQR